MRIALATAAHLPQCSEDDQVLIAAMRAAGMDAVPVVWDQPATWPEFDVVVLRSIWDYHLKYPQFLQWLDELDASGVPVHNSTDVVRWNADKRYMLELEARGVRITPTAVLAAGASDSLAALLGRSGWRNAVVKPTVSSTGYETWFVSAPPSAEDELRFERQTSQMDVLVQEFAEGVRAGELSLVFLRGQYSHAVLKRAAGSEFRVHVEHGGTVESVQPSAEHIAWAESVVAAITQPWTYARVDAVEHGGALVLMELELLDPELFFQYRPAAAEQLMLALTAGGIRAR